MNFKTGTNLAVKSVEYCKVMIDCVCRIRYLKSRIYLLAYYIVTIIGNATVYDVKRQRCTTEVSAAININLIQGRNCVCLRQV
jgi:hypothetical protein